MFLSMCYYFLTSIEGALIFRRVRGDADDRTTDQSINQNSNNTIQSSLSVVFLDDRISSIEMVAPIGHGGC